MPKKLPKGKKPLEIYYPKVIAQPVVQSCPYHKPLTAAYLFTVAAFCYLADGDINKCEKNASEILDFLEKEKYTDEEMEIYDKAICLFADIISKKIAPRGEWFIYDFPMDAIIQRLYLCFGDLISNPDCINDYVNAPRVCGELSDQVVFAVAFDEVFCLTIEYTNLL